MDFYIEIGTKGSTRIKGTIQDEYTRDSRIEIVAKGNA